MAKERDPRNFPEKMIYKVGEYGGMIGGVLRLLSGDITGAVAGGIIAGLSALLDNRSRRIAQASSR